MKKRRIALSLFALFAFNVNSFALTLSDIRTQIRRYILDDHATNRRYSDAELLSFINEIQRDFINRTWAIEASQSTTLTANTTYYDLPTDFIAINAVNYTDTGGNVYDLEEKSERYMYQSEPTYASQTGEPTKYFVRHSTSGADQLEISYNPIPDSNSAGGVVVMDYFNQVTDLSSDSDVPFDGLYTLYPYHEALIYGAVARTKLIEGNTEEAQAYQLLYNGVITVAVDRLGRSPNYNPSWGSNP